MSSRICFAAASPWTCTRYWPTQETRWSLNVPLISWWSKSGDRSSCMSAWGKPWVKGCSKKSPKMHELPHYNNYKTEVHTTTSVWIPYLSHNMPGLKVLIRKSVFSCQHWCEPTPSKSLGLALYLQEKHHCIRDEGIDTKWLTLGTSPGWWWLTTLVRGSQQYKDPADRYNANNDHQGIASPLVQSFPSLVVHRQMQHMHDITASKIVEKQVCPVSLCPLWQIAHEKIGLKF